MDHSAVASRASSLQRRSIRGTLLLLFAALPVAGGMSGGSCSVNPPDPGPGPGPGPGPTPGTRPVITAIDHVLVAPGANPTVTVVEYADFQCPFCGRFARSEFSTIKTRYIDTGKIRWVYRHFPLRNIHPRAEPAARASECASDQASFFDYADKTYSVTDGSAVILTDAQLRQNAVDLGLNMTDFDACYPPGDSKATRVQTDVNSGTALGVTGTPTFFVNARRVSGFQTADQLSAIIEQELGG